MSSAPKLPARLGPGLRGRILAAVLLPLALVAAVLFVSVVLNEDIFSWPWSLRLWFGSAAALVLLAAAGVAGWIVFSASVARRFERLARAAREMTGGATLVQVGPYYGPGELGRVERAFDAMVETIVHQKAEVEEARRTLDEAVSSLGDGLMLYDARERLVFCNEKSRELFAPIRPMMVPGARLDELARVYVGRTTSEANDHLREERLHALLARFRARDKNTLIRIDDGRWVRSAYYATSSGGTVVAMTDVTELVRREQELEALNRRIQAFAESSADWFWELDAALRFTFSTPGPSLLPPEDIRGKTRWEIDRVPDLNAGVWPPHRAQLERREPFRDFRFRLRATDGRIRTASISGLPIHAADGTFEGYCGIGRDITDDVEAVERLRLSEERFRALAETAPTGIYRTDAVGAVVFANDVWRKITALPPAPLDPATWRTAIHPEDQVRVTRAWVAALSIGQELRQEYRVRRPDGSVRWVVDTAAPERHLDGEMLGFVGTLADVTEKREIETRLEQSRRLEALGQLTGGIAHDFNNLLMIVLGNAEILEDMAERNEMRPDRLLRVARTVLSAAERGASLTQNLLGFARRRSVRPEKVAVHRRLQELGELLRRNLRSTVALVFDLSAERDEVMIDVAQLENAVINLTLNARDATPAEGQITISTRNLAVGTPSRIEDRELTPGTYLAVAIADTGTGMPPEVASRAIEPFFTTKPEGQGPGLGLSLAYGVAKQAGGELRIDTESGRGTTVTLMLPVVAQERGAGEGDRTREVGAIRLPGNPRVLVVDDDAPVLSVMAAQLGRLGCEPVSVSSAEDALRLLRTDQRFDLMFSDIDLGAGQDGFALAREARVLHPRLRILLTTGKLVRHGATGDEEGSPPILPKPFTLLELAEKLREVFGIGRDEKPASAG